MQSISQLVRSSVASHGRLLPELVHDELRLREDLELEPPDLVWIVMQVEALEPDRKPFPIDALIHVSTVGDLVATFDRWATKRDAELRVDRTGAARHEPHAGR